MWSKLQFDNKELGRSLSMQCFGGAFYPSVFLYSNQHIIWLSSVVLVGRVRMERILLMRLFEQGISAASAALIG